MSLETLPKNGQKDYKIQQKIQLDMRACLLRIAEDMLYMKSQQHYCLNMLK